MLKGRIVDFTADGNAVIICPIDLHTIIHRQVKEVYVEAIDSRPLSDKQRRMCYALMNAISSWSGEMLEGTKTVLKLKFRAENIESLGDKIFSLSNAPMSLVADFQRYLIEFIISNGVPLKFPLIDFVDDIRDYTYQCLIHKRCAVCGKRADLHHIDAIGMGNDRNAVGHIGREAMSLCRVHHEEIHSIGKAAFMEKYHLDGGIEIDLTICKIYGLKGGKK